jgi:HAD superfamily hydrolase (TIGR01662 family)
VAVKAVVLDVGETLVDETSYWGSIADSYGIPRLTFFGVFGAVIAAGEDHRRVFDVLGVEPRGGERAYRLYPDAQPALQELRGRGYRIGLAANQRDWAEAVLQEAGVSADFVGLSAAWGVHKPSPEFFARVVAEAGVEPEEIAYVGDRVDNDVEPALAAGMIAVHIRRGPWGYLQRGAERAHARIESLRELPAVLARV